jgi:hypothetical protein
MGRSTIIFEQDKLVSAINAVESRQTFPSRDAMFKAAIESYKIEFGGLNADRLTNILVYQRVKQWNVPLKTTAGKKGRVAGTKMEIKQRKSISSSSVGIKALLTQINTDAPPEMRGRLNDLVAKMQNGSLKAAIKLNCLNCANYQREEVKHCECYECPLFSIRPYKA